MDDYTRDLEYLLYLERQKPEYELKIEVGETPRQYKIRELKELAKIFEQEDIGVKLQRVRKEEK